MESKFIEGVKPLQQFMDDGSFLMPEIPAVLRAAQALHFPAYVDYDYLLSVSGMAWFVLPGSRDGRSMRIFRIRQSFTIRIIKA